MIRFMTLSFAGLGWALFELSGGTDFAPPEPLEPPRILAQAPEAGPRPEAPAQGPLVLVGASDFAVGLVGGAQASEAPAGGGLDAAIAAALALEAAPHAAPEPALERRTVSGSRVNLRGGPGTSHPVRAVLSRGEATEVLAVEGGWARIRAGDREGWMALSLLAPAG